MHNNCNTKSLCIKELVKGNEINGCGLGGLFNTTLFWSIVYNDPNIINGIRWLSRPKNKRYIIKPANIYKAYDVIKPEFNLEILLLNFTNANSKPYGPT